MQDDEEEEEDDEEEANSEQKLLKSCNNNGIISVEGKAMHNGVGVNGYDDFCLNIKMGW
jgi:hypothetical protein